SRLMAAPIVIFSATASAEIYTLSLHDALPISTFKKTLGEKGIIFCPISDAIKEHPELVKKYLGTVVPQHDNFYAALNSAVFSDGDRKSTRLNSSHVKISYAVFCLKKKT